MSNVSTVRIMMASYNGEKYLRKQIESIINQSYQNWSLIVQDDGSKDKTWEILEEYCKQDSRITRRRSPEDKHGAYYNFHSIANQEKESGKAYDYYMFCDQDDLWDNDKIERMLFRVQKEKSEQPVFCYADMRVIDEYDKEKISSICKAQGLKYINKESLFFSHNVYGCNTIMNRKAFYSIPLIDTKQKWLSILSHDNLYAKFSGILGKVIYYPETTMGYRRHGENVTSKHTYGFGIRRVLKRMLGLQDLAKDHARTYCQSLVAVKLLRERWAELEILNGKDEERKLEELSELDEIERAIKTGGLSTLKWIKNKNISWGNKTKDISHKVILGLCLYKKYLMDI